MDKNTIAVRLFDKYADDYANKYMDVGLYANELDRLCELLPAGAKILELACGPGNVTRYLLDKRDDLSVLATDLSAKMLAIAAKVNPGAEFKLLDCREIDGLTSKFDAVVCAFGLPYLSKEETARLIADSSRKLGEGGILFLSFMTDDYSRSGWQASSKGDKIFLYYHEKEFILQTLIDAGFIIGTVSGIESEMNGIPVTDLIIIAIKS